jgi:hypothetical protein
VSVSCWRSGGWVPVLQCGTRIVTSNRSDNLGYVNENAVTLLASTRKIPKSSSIANCVTIFRYSTLCMAASQMSTSLTYSNAILTSGILAEPNPNTFRTTDCDKSTPIRGSCEKQKQIRLSKYELSKSNCLLNGTEQVTLPMNELSEFHDWFVGGESTDGTTNVSEHSVSTSKTLFDSCTTLRNPIASSSFSIHSVRACEDSAYRVYSPPSRPVCRIVHGNMMRHSVTALGVRRVFACASPPLFPSPSKPCANPVPRSVGVSVKFTSVNRSKGIG